MKYVSGRNIPLITQEFYRDSRYSGILTMESYSKWYHMYMINNAGQVIQLTNEMLLKYDDITWINHAVSPAYFHETARNLNLYYDSETMKEVITRFVEDVLDEDWSKLYNYIPKDRLQ